MKFYYAPFLLGCAIRSASAFTVSQPSSAKSLALRSTLGETVTEWDMMSIAQGSGMVRCEGGSRKTFTFPDQGQEIVQIGMTTEGRPLNAEIELWIGPNWTPYSLKCFSDDGRQFPARILVGTRNKPAEIELRNVGQMELPFTAAASYAKPPLVDIRERIIDAGDGITVQGGAIDSIPLGSEVNQVRVYLKTDTRQLNTRVELLNGPNNIKQQFEVFTNNGVLNSLYVVMDTPGNANTIRIINQAPLEFPAYAYIEAI